MLVFDDFTINWDEAKVDDFLNKAGSNILDTQNKLRYSLNSWHKGYHIYHTTHVANDADDIYDKYDNYSAISEKFFFETNPISTSLSIALETCP